MPLTSKKDKNKDVQDHDNENVYAIFLYSLLILVLKIMVTRRAIVKYNSVATQMGNRK